MAGIVDIETWPGPWERYARNYCIKNAWRVTVYLGDWDDCMAECAYIYVECLKRYGATVKSQAQFMALYKMMIHSYFAYWSTDDSKDRVFTSRGDVCTHIASQQADLPSFLAVRFRKTSSELGNVLKIMNYAPLEIMQTLNKDCRTPMSFFRKVAKQLGLGVAKTDKIILELRTLLQQ